MHQRVTDALGAAFRRAWQQAAQCRVRPLDAASRIDGDNGFIHAVQNAFKLVTRSVHRQQPFVSACGHACVCGGQGSHLQQRRLYPPGHISAAQCGCHVARSTQEHAAAPCRATGADHTGCGDADAQSGVPNQRKEHEQKHGVAAQHGNGQASLHKAVCGTPYQPIVTRWLRAWRVPVPHHHGAHRNDSRRHAWFSGSVVPRRRRRSSRGCAARTRPHCAV